MKKILHKLVFAAVFLIAAGAIAQDKTQLRGDKQYERHAYIDAIKVYERAAERGHKNAELLKRLGDAYYFNGEFQSANKWYASLFELTQDVPSEYLYRYSQTLKSIQSYTEADAYLKAFSEKELNDKRAKLAENNKDYLKQIEINSGRYDFASVSINSEYSDYGSVVYDKKLIFASARDTGSVAKRIHMWTNNSFTTLYESAINEDGTYGAVKKFAPSVRTKFNESTPVFTADGNTMYFTRNNFNNGVRGKDAEGMTLLKIYRSQKVGDKWGKAEELSFNGDNFSSAHPALTPDGKWMYFASDRQGGSGQSDLYKVAVLPSGGFGNPINLGPEINTGGRESFPFISKDDELYFSSDGHPGLGGLDIFAVKILKDGSFGVIKNVGTPANSSADDFAFMINNTTKKGYLSSNRAKGYGKDDIYSVLETRKLALECLQIVNGVVYDKQTDDKMANAKVRLYDSDFKLMTEVTTDAAGKYQFNDLICGNKYRINASLEEFNTAEVTVELPIREGITQVDFGLEKTRVKVEKGDDLFKVLKLAPIYFDFDKADIRNDAAVELAKVVGVLEQYPQMKIDIRSHTDSRGDDKYNLRLSDRRAQSTMKWIIAQGIDASRVNAKGYGETRLINTCANGVKCSDEEHQENRRSEFIVLDL
ncbi:OmpA family protein [Flavobacterium sp. JP2137]|uniref:OmpA family protein n=1 Tax=Flavobacterium sp. JP2137 TaxID=3414510 RepID=UPI003D2F9FA6